MTETLRRIPGNERMSAAVLVNGMVFLKGVTPRSGATVEEQTTDVLSQIDGMLERAGTSRDRLVSVSVWLRDISDMAGLNSVYDRWVPPENLPVRACVQAALARPDYRVEIQVTAAL